MYISTIDFLFHDLTDSQADELFVLAQEEIFSKSVFNDSNELVVNWIKIAKTENCRSFFHLTFPSRALISVSAHYKAKLVQLKTEISVAEDYIPENSDFWIEKRKIE